LRCEPQALTLVRPLGVRAPVAWLLDARAAGFDEAALRAWARAECAKSGAPYASRSYAYPYAVIVGHAAAVGVDIERVESCSMLFADLICTPSERVRLIADDDRLDDHLTNLWSSKEALAKGLGDALDYHPARLESPTSWPGGCAGAWRGSALRAPAGYCAWLCWHAAQSGS